MKRKIFLLLSFIMILPVFVFAMVSPSSLLYVTDEGSVLTEDTKDYIVRYSDFLQKEEDVRYYVVTVSNLETYDLDTYADYVYGSFGLGRNGILIFFTKDERMVKVICGDLVGEFLSDEEIEEAIDLYMMPYFKNEEWDLGIKNGYSAFYKIICNYYQIDSSPMEVFDGNDFITKYQYPILAVLVFLGSIISYVFCTNLKKRKKDSKHFLLFGLCLLGNFIVLLFAYQINRYSILLVLGSELITYMSVFGNSSSLSFEDAIRKAQMEEKKKKRRKRKR